MNKKYLLISLGLISSLVYANRMEVIQTVRNPKQFFDLVPFIPDRDCSEFHRDIADFLSPLNEKQFSSTIKCGDYYNISITRNQYGIGDIKYIINKANNTYYYYQFIYVPVLPDRLREEDKKLVQYFGGNHNSKIQFIYSNDNPPNINNVWGLGIDNHLYLAVWVLDPETDTEQLVDRNRTVIATKSKNGKISFLNK